MVGLQTLPPKADLRESVYRGSARDAHPPQAENPQPYVLCLRLKK
jgi:hypothetical protein